MRRFRIPRPLIAAFTALCLYPAGIGAHAAPRHPAQSAVAPDADAAIALAIKDEAGGALKHFYRERDYRPLWIEDGRIGPEAGKLIGFLSTAELDGLKPSSYDPDELAEAVDKARDGDPRDVARAELKLSAAFAKYVRDQRKPPDDIRVTYADRKLKPRKLKPE